MTTYRLTVNGTPRSVEASDPDEPLLYILRNALGLEAAKFGCGQRNILPE
jgi:nicotinate dehydrogenase subunit A